MNFAKRRLMKTALIALACAALPAGAAHAATDPIPGVDVVVERVPPGNAIGRFTTDSGGILAFRSLEAGGYRVRDIAGKYSASIKHAGGPARWRLVSVQTARDGAVSWALEALPAGK